MLDFDVFAGYSKRTRCTGFSICLQQIYKTRMLSSWENVSPTLYLLKVYVTSPKDIYVTDFLLLSICLGTDSWCVLPTIKSTLKSSHTQI